MAGAITAHAGPAFVQCNGIKDLVFVAHQDDDLLFMNPDIQSTIDSGGCVQVVYLTASERGEGEGYMLGRERGVRSAYSYMAQEPNIWAEDFATIHARRVARFTLHGNKRLQLLHLRLKDPWLGKGWGSLTPLSRTESVVGATVESLGPAAQTYSRSDLVEFIEYIIQDYQPSTIRHMDDSVTVPYERLCWGCAGHSHPDHIASARLVHDAITEHPGNYAEVAYLDYPSQERAANLSATEINQKTEAFRRYAWDDYRYCANASLCREPAGPAAAWVGRAYYVSRHDEAPSLLSRSEGGFLLFAVGEANAAANTWQSVANQWISLGGRTADSIAAFKRNDGRAAVFARDATGLAWVSNQTPAGSWTTWQQVAGSRITSLPVVSTRGPLLAIAMGNDGFLHYAAAQSGTGTWAPWRVMPPLPGVLPQVALAYDNTGASIVFATDGEGRLWHGSYRGDWSPWRQMEVPQTDGGLAAMQNADHVIELYLREKSSGHLLRITQQADAVSGWSQPIDLGVVFINHPTIALNEAGEVAVATLERRDGPLWLIEAGRAMKVAAKVGSLPALQTIDGAFHVAARSPEEPQAYWVRVRRHGVWEAPLLLAAPPAHGGGAFQPVPATDVVPIKPLPSRYALQPPLPVTAATRTVATVSARVAP